MLVVVAQAQSPDNQQHSCGQGCLYTDPNLPPMTPACASARFHAIQTDERFPSVLDVLLRHGFATGDRSDPAWLEKALPYLGGGGVGPSTNTNHLIWNAVMQSRAADYYTRALVTSAVRHYPSLRASNFRFSKWSRSYCVPDEGRAVMFCNTPPELHGAVVGGDANGFSTAALYNNFISSE